MRRLELDNVLPYFKRPKATADTQMDYMAPMGRCRSTINPNAMS